MSAGVCASDRACLIALASVPGVGPATLLRCLRGDGPQVAWDRLRRGLSPASPQRRADDEMVAAARRLDPAAVLDRHRRAGLQVLVHGEPGYPMRLLEDPSPPPLLFARGDLGILDRSTVAIVGTRNATKLGCELVRQLAAQLAARGICVASGLALGIDGAAHRAVVDIPDGSGATDPPVGRPIGVVAAGMDRPYPRRHRLLHDQVAAHGVLLTEVPLGGQPRPWRFPARNRIIAGISDAVVVAESRSTGGSMSTVAEALTRGVAVLAVPGHPYAPAAAGTNDLIAEGAAPVRDVEDILVAIGRGGERPQDDPAHHAPPTFPATPLAGSVLDALEAGPLSLAGLVEATGASLEAIATTLGELQGAGAIARTDGWYEQTGTVRGRGAG